MKAPLDFLDWVIRASAFQFLDKIPYTPLHIQEEKPLL
jgi:hypothetical protein